MMNMWKGDQSVLGWLGPFTYDRPSYAYYKDFSYTEFSSALPVIVSPSSASGKLKVAFSYQTRSTGTPQSFAAEGLPAGLSIDPTTGLISGTPLWGGNFSAKLSATNQNGTGTQTLSLTIARR